MCTPTSERLASAAPLLAEEAVGGGAHRRRRLEEPACERVEGAAAEEGEPRHRPAVVQQQRQVVGVREHVHELGGVPLVELIAEDGEVVGGRAHAAAADDVELRGELEEREY